MKFGVFRTIVFIIMAAGLVFIIGCSKLTTQNYNKIKMGMDYNEVVVLLGDADKCDAALGAKSCIWGDENKHIQIKFLADKVVLFSGKGI